MQKISSSMTITALILSAAFLASTAHAEGGRFHRKNASGGITAGSANAGTGPNGTKFQRASGVLTDGAGNGVATSGGQVQTATGGLASRRGKTTRTADGAVQHDSSASASGDRGNINSQGSATRAADGTITQSRTTQASDANGNNYNGATSYSKDTGVTHTGTCTDASGNSIPCRK